MAGVGHAHGDTQHASVQDAQTNTGIGYTHASNDTSLCKLARFVTMVNMQASLDSPYVDLPVVRRNGTDGRVTVEYATHNGTGPAAIAGRCARCSMGQVAAVSGVHDGMYVGLPLQQ